MLKFRVVLTEFSIIMLGFSTFQLVFFDYERSGSSFGENLVSVTFAIVATIFCLLSMSVYLRERAKLGGAEEFLIEPNDGQRVFLKWMAFVGAIGSAIFCICLAYFVAGFREAYCYTVGFGIAFISMIEEIDQIKRRAKLASSD